MRILHVISSMAPSSGGPTSVVASLLVAQAHSGLNVAVCTTNHDNPTSKRLEATFLHSILPPAVAVHPFPAEVTSLLISRALRAWLKQNIDGFDLVHVHGLYRFPPTYAAWQARKQEVPYIIRPHGSLDPFLYGKSSRSVALKRLYERWFDLPNLHAAGAIHYTAEEERERAAYLKLHAPSFVIPNGVDWQLFEKLPERGSFRSAHKLGDTPLILFLGRLHLTKGLDILIPAFDAVRRTVPDAQLAIVGPENDDYGQKVRGWVRERGLDETVHFIGHLDSADVIQAYVDADVFVLPSYTENFGMTVVEAMACGRPVVISDQVNIHREVSAAGAGLVTRCDAIEVAQTLIGLLNDAGRRCAMGEAGRRMVQERYTWPPIVDALTREYQAVVERHRQGASSRKREWSSRA